MKKFLLSLCVLAVAGVCMFMTSCKDGDELATRTRVVNNVEQAIAAVENPNFTYTYVLNGVSYNSLSDLSRAIENLPAGSENTIYVIAQPNDGGEPITGPSSPFVTPQPGQPGISVPVVIPDGTGGTGGTGETAIIDIKTIEQDLHNGGLIK